VVYAGAGGRFAFWIREDRENLRFGRDGGAELHSASRRQSGRVDLTVHHQLRPPEQAIRDLAVGFARSEMKTARPTPHLVW
jgi:hypothetical protein